MTTKSSTSKPASTPTRRVAKKAAKSVADVAKTVEDGIKGGLEIGADLTAAAMEAVDIFAVVAAATPIIRAFEGIHDGNPDKENWQPAPDPAGYIAIGYGRTLRHPDEPRFLRWNSRTDRRIANEMYPDGITPDEAEVLLIADIRERLATLRQYEGYRNLSTSQQASLLSMAYNIGISGLLHSTLWKFIEAGQTAFDPMPFALLMKASQVKAPITQIDEAFGAWSRFTDSSGRKVFSVGLFMRRFAELLMFTGIDAEEALQTADKEMKEVASA